MKNELLWILMLLVNFGAIIFSYKKFGKLGLFIWIPISAVVANIQVILFVNLFGFEATLGNIVYASSFLVTDILSENYGEEDAKKSISIGFFSLIMTTLIMQIALSFMPSDFPEAHTNLSAVSTIFSFMPRIVMASLAAYLISQKHDVWAYAFWKKKFSGKKHIWIRNNASTMISQLLDSAIFTVIAFWGVMDLPVLWEIFLSTYILKWIVAFLDTPFIYLASYLKEKKMLPKEVLA